MSRLLINPGAIEHNYRFLDELFRDKDISWSVTTKVLSGYEPFLAFLVDLGARAFSDSRLENLKLLRKLCPDAELTYIRPPNPLKAREVVKFANVSLNTELETILALSETAADQGKVHEVIIMVELGELREGIMPGGMMELYVQSAQLPGIRVAGFGTYFSRVEGVAYIFDKLAQFTRCKRTLEEKFDADIPLCSAGTSIILPNLIAGKLPQGINHFRIGESLFLATNLVNTGYIEGLEKDAFRFCASILELKDKPRAFTGEIPEDCEGGYEGERAVRAVLDTGKLDVPADHLYPEDEKVKVITSSTDLLVIDLSETGKSYRLGEEIYFNVDYTALLALMHSRYVDKEIVTPLQPAS